MVVEDRRNDRVQVGGLAQADFAGQIRSTAFKGGGELLEGGEVLEAIHDRSGICSHPLRGACTGL